MRSIFLILVACIVAGGAGYLAYRHFAQGGNQHLVTLPQGIRMNDLEGHAHTLDEWRGKLLLVNFWATWCGPCLHEIPELVKLQGQYAARGFQVVGPAVDDPDAVRGALAGLGIDYPVLITTEPEDMLKVMDTLDNSIGGLPFSLLVAPDGRIVKRQLGEFSFAELAALIEANLPKTP